MRLVDEPDDDQAGAEGGPANHGAEPDRQERNREKTEENGTFRKSRDQDDSSRVMPSEPG